jgi:Cu+-exporting ATPase
MIRRKFIQKVTCGLAAIETATAAASKKVTYRITGFTCVTCAVGLDTMLKEKKGIVKSKSSYPDKTSVIEFKPDAVTEVEIKQFIEELGFKAN